MGDANLVELTGWAILSKLQSHHVQAELIIRVTLEHRFLGINVGYDDSINWRTPSPECLVSGHWFCEDWLYLHRISDQNAGTINTDGLSVDGGRFARREGDIHGWFFSSKLLRPWIGWLAMVTFCVSWLTRLEMELIGVSLPAVPGTWHCFYYSPPGPYQDSGRNHRIPGTDLKCPNPKSVFFIFFARVEWNLCFWVWISGWFARDTGFFGQTVSPTCF